MNQDNQRTIVTRLRQAVDALEHQVDSAGGQVNDRVMMAVAAAQANLREAIEQMSQLSQHQSMRVDEGLSNTGGIPPGDG